MALGAAVPGPAVLGAALAFGPAAAPGSASTPTATARATATAAAGPARCRSRGPKLASRGVVVDYASKQAPRLRDIQASSFIVAGAGTGQVLAGKDPHG
jgi:D-alanyl-D-alanine carboxypeptidase